MAATDQSGDSRKTSVLFVCLGNICRSPSAEAVFNAVVERNGVADQFVIDSCGTGGGNPDWYQLGTPQGWSYHEGDQSDPRMRKAAAKRNMQLTSRSRPLRPEDFSNFDWIIGMDDSNIAAIKQAADHWAADHSIPSDYRSKVKKMTTFLRADEFKHWNEVPDPYFGTGKEGEKGFELVLDLLEDACDGLLEETGVKQPAS